MRFFLDTEFIEDGRTIDLVSIAVVSENGQEFYRQNAQADFRHANEFVQTHVIPKLWDCPSKITGPRHVYGMCPSRECVWRPKRAIRDELLAWVRDQSTGKALTENAPAPASKPEFWGYYADYDWVALCQLFGMMIDLPSGWPMYCRDLKQYVDYLGNFDLPPEGVDEHNALTDARWLRGAYEYVAEVEGYYRARRKVTRPVDKEPEAVRSPEEEGYEQVAGGGNQQRLGQEVPEKEGVAVDGEGVTFV